MYLNIHDLVRVRIDSRESNLNDIRREFGYFVTDQPVDYDIRLEIGEFTPDTSGCTIVEGKYHFKDNYTYYADKAGKAKWAVELSNWSGEPTKIRVKSQIGGLKNRILHQNFIAKDLLLRAIESHLVRRDHVLLHGAAVAKNNEAFIFYGRGGSFKTTLIMDLIRNHDFELLGDDHIIIGNGQVMSFPENLPIFGYMLRNLQTERSWSLIDKLKFGTQSFLDNQHECTVPVHDKCPITTGFNISRTHAKQLSIEDDSKTIEKMILNNQMEDLISLEKVGIGTGILEKTLLARSIVDPILNSQEKRKREILKSQFDSIPIKKLRLPTNYNKNLVSQLRSRVLE